jgi:hypothetical protein
MWLCLICSLQFFNHNRRSTTSAIADACHTDFSAFFVKYSAQGADDSCS